MAFIECSNNIIDIYNDIDKYNPNKKRKVLIIFDYVIANMLSNKKLNPIVTVIIYQGQSTEYLIFIRY